MAGVAVLAVLAGCGKPGSAVGAKDGEQVAATVNGEPISMQEYCDHMGAKQTAQIMTERGATSVRVLGSFGLQSMQELVDQQVLLQMAKEEGVAPTDADVDAELEFQTELVPPYVGLLHDQGLTDAMIRHELMIGLAREHLVMKGVTVTPEEVEQYLKAHPERFASQAKASILFIQVRSAAQKAAVDAALAAGKAFGVVAKDMSEAPNRFQEGAYPIDVISQMPKEIQGAVNMTPEKGTSGWVTAGKSFVKVYIVKKTPASVRKPSAAERELVRRDLAMDKGQVKNNFDHRYLVKLKGANVQVEIAALKDPWTKSWNQLSDPGAAPPPGH